MTTERIGGLYDNGLHVIADGFVEGMGMNVSVTGDYIQDEPYYTRMSLRTATMMVMA